MDAPSVFSNIYATDAWGSGSGPGSTPKFCRPLVDWLSRWIVRNRIDSIVDLGCGDCQWMPEVAMTTLSEYTGVDVVLDVIHANKSRHGAWAHFLWDDFRTDPAGLPEGDLYWAKDVLQHWPDDEIVSWLDRFFAAKPDATLLVCNCSHQATTPRVLDSRWHFAPLSGSLPPLCDYSPQMLFQWSTKTVHRLFPAGHHRSGSALRAPTSDAPAA